MKSYFRALRQVLRLARLVLLAGLVWVGVLAASRFGLITLPEALVGPSVTPAAAAVEAQKVIQNEMTAVKTHDRTLLEASETGPALETDQAAFANPAPLEAAEPFSIVQVAVPHQSGYPARFLAVASTQVGGKGIFGIYSFVKSNARSPWLSDFNVFTDAGQPRPIFRIDPQGWTNEPAQSAFLYTPDQAAQGYASYLGETWATVPATGTKFADGPYISSYRHDDQLFLQNTVHLKDQATGSYRPEQLTRTYQLTDGGGFVMSSQRVERQVIPPPEGA